MDGNRAVAWLLIVLAGLILIPLLGMIVMMGTGGFMWGPMGGMMGVTHGWGLGWALLVAIALVALVVVLIRAARS